MVQVQRHLPTTSFGHIGLRAHLVRDTYATLDAVVLAFVSDCECTDIVSGRSAGVRAKAASSQGSSETKTERLLRSADQHTGHARAIEPQRTEADSGPGSQYPRRA